MAGVGAIATLLDKEHFPAPQKKAATHAQDEASGLGWLLPLVFFGVFFLLPLLRGGARRGLRRDGWGSDAAGVILGSVIGNALSNASRGDGRFGGGGGGFGGGGGGGGFGGGGGGFDGGGASGNW